jgi:hypothetical protein
VSGRDKHRSNASTGKCACGLYAVFPTDEHPFFGADGLRHSAAACFRVGA